MVHSFQNIIEDMSTPENPESLHDPPTEDCDCECGKNEEEDEETLEDKSNDPVNPYLIAFVKIFFWGCIIFETVRFLYSKKCAS